MANTTYTLVLLRHGQSDWNEKNLFTGWVDVPLTEKGRAEATRGGELMAAEGIAPDVLHTSLLKRAITTANLALEAADRQWIPVKRDWRLNERHYGALQGKDKAQVKEEFGEEQFMVWRRSFDTPPPALDDSSEFSQAGEERYAELGDDAPRTETLDLAHADRIHALNVDVNALHLSVFRAIASPDWTASPSTTTDVTLASRYFERFTDHGLAVALKVRYLVTGECHHHRGADANGA